MMNHCGPMKYLKPAACIATAAVWAVLLVYLAVLCLMWSYQPVRSNIDQGAVAMRIGTAAIIGFASAIALVGIIKAAVEVVESFKHKGAKNEG